MKLSSLKLSDHSRSELLPNELGRRRAVDAALRFERSRPDGRSKPYVLVRGGLEALKTCVVYVELALREQRHPGHRPAKSDFSKAMTGP